MSPFTKCLALVLFLGSLAAGAMRIGRGPSQASQPTAIALPGLPAYLETLDRQDALLRDEVAGGREQ